MVKRDGSIETYDRSRITDAIAKAIRAVRSAEDPDLAESLSQRVEEKIHDVLSGRHPNSVPAIEEIQDIVETVLIESGDAAVAKAYILYRARHESIRDTRKLVLDINETMDGYLSRSDWRVNENANVNFSLGGLILHNSGTITANYWLKNIYTQEIAEAHRTAAFHIHDLSMFSGYCAGWSLRQLIQEGLGGVPDKISSRPARHLSTLVQQIVNFLGIMQNEWAGAQAFSSFDTYLAPFVKKDNLSFDEVTQNIQTFIFGVNTPSRWGSQAPFTNITLDWTVPPDLAGRKAVVGGEEQEFTYGDCQSEMNMINRAFIELMLAGDAEGRGFQYPIPTYNLTEDFDWDSENGKLLFEMTAKYGTPYFQNFINSDLNPGDVRSMCCRLQLDKRELRKRGGGLFGSDEFTGSLGVVTINLPRIGYLSESRVDFFHRLTNLMDLAAQSLVIKRKVIERLMEGGLFPYTRRYLGHLNNHFSTIGICGMNECSLNFLGKDISTREGADFAEEVLEYMRRHLSDLQEDTGDLFNLEATPAESTSYRLAKHDREAYPDIITSGDSEPFYTNSTQLPVDHTSDVFEALDHQDRLQTKYTGGTVFHAFLGEAVSDWEACRKLVKAIAYTYHLPYFTISPTFSVCPNHGYLAGEHFTCPHCGADAEVYSRIVGYYRSVRNWNRGKQEEFGIRKLFEEPAVDIEKERRAGRAANPAAGRVKGTGERDRAGDNVQAGLADRAGDNVQAGRGTPPGNAHGHEQTGGSGRGDVAAGSTGDGSSREVHSYILFFRETCPNCPPVKRVLHESSVDGREVNVDTPEGLEEALSLNVMAAPTVICLDENGEEIGRSYTADEVGSLLCSTAAAPAAL
ncbi:MAG: ribonucleoside triphosphate reductase [Spirochaetota bacterium]|nr:ribonucleoside triphosphate reductase [Spirochaetota bacterium]